MPVQNKLVIVIILILSALLTIYGQDKLALKYNEEVNFEVKIKYLSGDEGDYKYLLLFKSGIAAAVRSMLNSTGIHINDKIGTPKLVIKVSADQNLKNKSSGNETWYYITSEIFLLDKVKVIDHPSIRIETITWRGESTRTFVNEQNVGIIRNEDIAKIANSFIKDYLEINPN